MKRNVIVFGATGKTGIQVCKQLIQQKITFSVFTRQESSNKLTFGNTSIIEGNVLNEKDVEKAFEKKEFTDVIIALGSKALKGSDIRSIGTENIIKAMKAHSSVAKIHVISALGVGVSWSQLKWHAKLISNLLLKSVMTDHGKQEEIIIDSSYDYHIIRPAALKDGNASGKIYTNSEGFLPNNYISRADVAKYLIDCLNAEKIGFSSLCES